MSAARGTVYLVGAGPGDPGLITVRGAELLASADVVVYDGLIGEGLLEIPRADAESIYAGKKRTSLGGPRSQEEICALLVDRARAGRSVVRLKGGDPLVFGRVSEELVALVGASIPFEVVPGVSSLTAAPAYAGIPLTRRGVASTVAFATGHAAAGRELEDSDFGALARADTIVLFMAVSTLKDCCRRLVAAGRAAATPAVAIHWGTTAAQRTVHATLGEISQAVGDADLQPPALIVIGDVTAAENRYEWRGAQVLAGARVLVPRPRGRAVAFTTAISELGGEPLVAPLTRLVPAPAEQRKAASRALSTADPDWLLFSSASAVEAFTAALLESGSDVRRFGRARIGCVGESTARSLAAVGLRADLIPARRSSKNLASAVLAELGDAASEATVLVVRAHGGREDAEVALAAKGATAIAVALYQSQASDPSEPAVSRLLRRLDAGELDAAAFFAPSQVEAFFALVGERAGPRLAAVPVVAAIGATTAAALERRGVRVDVVASQPDPRLFASEIAAALVDSTKD